MINLIEGDGWRFHSQKGSHRQFTHATKKGSGNSSRKTRRSCLSEDVGKHFPSSTDQETTRRVS
ncbi:MAG: type II toxin-antitoxin system HicA family toxin, partial [Bryobacteraceae bacterium]